MVSLTIHPTHYIALVDGNNFFVSCERLFRPDLNGKPVIVLSNNDGCAIARSNEAKALGIKMGDPYFKIKSLIQKHKIAVFSSHFSLYGNLSHRMMTILSSFTPDIEIYSVDEAFLYLKDFAFEQLRDLANQINNTLWRDIAIPSCVGIAPTKTLAKLANFAAKKLPDYHRYCILMNSLDIRKLLPQVPVAEVWGIGRQSAKKLNAIGVITAQDLADLPLKEGRYLLSVYGEKIIQELNGISCFEMSYEHPDQKNLAVTRSFGSRITELAQLEEALMNYVSKAAEKLRKKDLLAQQLYIFIRTSPFQEGYVKRDALIPFSDPTNNGIVMMKKARLALKKIFVPGLKYQKAGVVCCGLIRPQELQPKLFDFEQEPGSCVKEDKSAALLKVMDQLNQKMGPGTVYPLSTGIKKSWQIKSLYKSDDYLSCFGEVRKVWAR